MVTLRTLFGRRGTVFAVSALVFLLAAAVPVFSMYVATTNVPAGSGPAAVAVNPVSHRVYVGNYYSSNVSVYDGLTMTSLGAVSTGRNLTVPDAVVVDPLTSPARVYAANFWTGTIAVIDEQSLCLTATISSAGMHGGGARALALDAGAATPKLYVAEYGKNRVAVYEPISGALLALIPTGVAPRALGIFSSLTRTRVYVANRGSNTVSVIDGATDQVVATIPAAAPKAIAVDPTTGWAWVTDEGDNSVTVIDDTDSLRGVVNVGIRPVGIAIDSANGRAFVANASAGSVSVIRTSDLSTEATLAVGATPWAVAFDAGDQKAFVTCYGSNSLAVIDSALGVSAVAVGRGPYGVAIDEGVTPHQTYVANHLDGTVSLVKDNGLAMGPLGARVAYAAELSPVAVVVDPLMVAPDGSVTIAGTARSTRPFPARIARLDVSVDGSSTWYPAQVQESGDGAQVSWSVGVGTLTSGQHSIKVRVLDQTSAATASSDFGTSGQSGVSLIALQQDVSVGLSLQPMQGRACQTCHGGTKPGNRKNAPPDALKSCPFVH